MTSDADLSQHQTAAEQHAPRGLSHRSIALVVIILVAAGLRVWNLGEAPFEYDELWTLELSTGRGSVHLTTPRGAFLESAPATTSLEGAPPFWTVWTTMETATHPPLYFMALRVWREVFGGGDVAARSLSVVASVVAVGLTFDLAFRLFGLAPAVAAAAVMAIAPAQIEYAQQARNYALLTMLAAWAAWCVVRIERDGATILRPAALAAAVLATALTHYFSIGFLGALFAYALLRLRGRDRFRGVAAFGIAGFVFLVVWGPFLLGHVRRFSGEDATTDFLTVGETSWFKLVLAAPVRVLTEPRGLHWWVLLLGCVLYVGPSLLIRRSAALLLPVLWLIGSVGFVALLDGTRGTSHLAFLRYIFLAGPAVYLLIGGALREWKWGPALTSVVAGAACLMGLLNVYESREPDWRLLADAIEGRASAGDVLVFYDDSVPGGPGDPYLGWSHFASSREHPAVLLDVIAPGEVMEKLRDRRVWLVYGSSRRTPEQLLPEWRATAQIDLHGPPVRVYAMAKSGS